MTWETWSVYLVTWTVLCVTPGPAVLFVVSNGLGRGAAAALWASAGILGCNTLYFLLSATGLGAVLAASWSLFVALKWLGAGYLILLGLRSFSAASATPAVVPARERDAPPRVLLRGFLVQGANPKALLSFTALLPQFIDSTRAIAPQVAILGATGLVVELGILAAWGTLAARSARFMARPGFVAWSQRAAGALLIAAGVRVARLEHAVR